MKYRVSFSQARHSVRNVSASWKTSLEAARKTGGEHAISSPCEYGSLVDFRARSRKVRPNEYFENNPRIILMHIPSTVLEGRKSEEMSKPTHAPQTSVKGFILL